MGSRDQRGRGYDNDIWMRVPLHHPKGGIQSPLTALPLQRGGKREEGRGAYHR